MSSIPSAWGNIDEFEGHFDLRWFRGDTPFQSDPAELPRAARLKAFILLGHLQERDHYKLFERLGEDGLFGCWTYDFPERPRVSWELLTSVNLLLLLGREVGLFDRTGLRVLDLHAGYGGLAHRMASAAPLADVCCLDERAEATFLCEYYLHLRGCVPPARVVSLQDVGNLDGPFDLAIADRGFAGRPREKVCWWLQRLRGWEVPTLLLLSDEPTGFTSLESDGLRLDLLPVLAQVGYRLVRDSPVIDDPAVRAMVKLHDRFLLFEHAE